MKLRRYQGKTYQEALAQVREDLGPDAVILTTKELTQGGLFGLFSRAAVEIVAATDVPIGSRGTGRTRSRGAVSRDAAPKAASTPARPSPSGPRARAGDESASSPQADPASSPQADPASQARGMKAYSVPRLDREEPAPSKAADVPLVDDSRLRQMEESLADMRRALELVASRDQEAASLVRGRVSEGLVEPFKALVRAGVDEACAARILHEFADGDGGPNGDLEPQATARTALAQVLRASGPILGSGKQSGGKIVAMVGPTGVGKTTTIAKLAAQYALIADKKVGLLTVDTYRVAAVEQLRTFAEIMALPIEVASSPEEARGKLSVLSSRDLVLVDTAGRSHNAEDRIEELQRLMEAIEPDEIHLVLSAGTKPADLTAAGREFGRLGVNRLVFTKVDETSECGGMATLAHEMGLPVSYITHGQKVPEDIQVAEADGLASLVLEGYRGNGDA
ncbi:MAG: flagellar biosynthesis protein FlhF [Armatimonadia bacterium]|nr:flagellar biosynthesis protein FlhF [Armatimonadia bacterium]